MPQSPQSQSPQSHYRPPFFALCAAALLLFVSACEVKQAQAPSTNTVQQPEQTKSENLPPPPSSPPTMHEYDMAAKVASPSSGFIGGYARQPIPWLDSTAKNIRTLPTTP